jgi:sucrose-6-phosphate hydrolase SacC (GH32 family)
MQVDGFKGHGLVNSFYKGDKTTGTLTSPEFKIERRFISFLIGGGGWSNLTCMNLLVDGKIARTATGPNIQAGGSEMLAPASWDVSELAGRTVRIEIVDNATGGWGHINVDHIVQTDRRPPQLLTNAERRFKIEKRYLNLPIKNGAPKRNVTSLVDGFVEVKNDIELAKAEPDWWAFTDVSAWRGKTVTLRVDKLPEDSTALSSIEQSDSIKDTENLYREPLRGQFHFSSRRGWNNDPNGMIFFNGEYHLFYQHNPYGWNWGNMHWGHAVSRDMVHWQELPDALSPDELGPMFSGSAVVDWANTSGFGKPGRPAQVLVYTAAGNPTVQCIAFSTDGRHYTKFAGNPVVKQITRGNRDPKVMWHEPTKKWVMCLYVERNNVHTIHFLGSINLKDWTLMSQTEGFFECPDFFELPIDGDTLKKKWVLTAASSEYMVGSFDGTKFTPETSKLPGHRGVGFYAAQTFSNIPADDGRHIQIGWFQTATPGMPFNQSMTIPLELKLTSTSDGPRLTWTPVKELASLRAKSHSLDPVTLQPGSANPLAGVKAELIELRAGFEPDGTSEVVFTVRGATILYDAKKQELAVNDHRAPAPLRGGKQQITIYCDRTGLEVFASDGLTYIPMPFIPKAGDLALGLRIKGGSAKFTALQVHELKSAWSPQ